MKNTPAFLPYGRQSLTEDDIAAVVEVLRGNWLTCGPRVPEFEQALAAYCGAKHAVAVANGTAALHVAMLAAGLKAGDRVLTSANTFLASANCAEFVGATADFADIDPWTYNVTAETLEAAWKPDVKAIVPVDFAGQPCDMPAIAALARQRGAIIIEDASHAIGSRFQYEGKEYKVGGHPWADMTTFSFHPVKTITTGEGGAILTNDDKLAERCRLFRSHGMIKDPALWQFVPDTLMAVSGSVPSASSAYYEMHELGYNYRITDIQCALGLSQLKKLDSFIQRRSEIVAQYNAAFASLPFVRTPQISSIISQSKNISWHLFVIQIDFKTLCKTRANVMCELHQSGIGTQVHYVPVYLQPYYRHKYGYAIGKCKVAEAYYQHCLSLPLFPSMLAPDAEKVIKALRNIMHPLVASL